MMFTKVYVAKATDQLESMHIIYNYYGDVYKVSILFHVDIYTDIMSYAYSRKFVDACGTV